MADTPAPPAGPPAVEPADPPVLRPILDDERDQVASLWRDAGLTRDGAASEVLALPGVTILVAVEAERVVGATAVWLGTVARIAAPAVADAAPEPITAFLDRVVAWLGAHGARRVEILADPAGDPTVDAGILGAAGWREAAGRRWLRDLVGAPPAPRATHATVPERYLPRLELDGPRLRVVVTYLALPAPADRRSPRRITLPRVPGRGAVSLMRLVRPSVAFYRFLYGEVGAPWLWYERRRLDDLSLARAIQAGTTEVWLLSVDGNPAGYFELDRRDPEDCNLSYFGLMPEYLGTGLGGFLMESAIEAAFSATPRPRRLKVNTCTLDHPRALGTYQRAGFVPYRQDSLWIEDPRRDPANGFPPP